MIIAYVYVSPRELTTDSVNRVETDLKQHETQCQKDGQPRVSVDMYGVVEQGSVSAQTFFFGF